MDQSSTRTHCHDEDCAEERRLDALKGFASLESFEELLAWTEDDVDALQRSNTPLLRRAQPEGEHGAKVMLIHDYMGGYNEYESCQGLVVSQELYSCDYLQFVETFVYFSHRLVAIPPPAWINTCHRNGVTVLGTLIVEPGSADVECILQQDELGSFWVARKLAKMAKCYGFDGWLINIETSFSLLSWSAAKLEGFLCQLRAELGVDGKVVWYDALTTLNFVWYQNTLNYVNLQFALAAGSMLTNYAWNPDLAQSGKVRALESDLGLENLYFGIDVWAQNHQKDSKHKRITWPKLFGGGTGTGLGVQVLQELGLNVGIFAPAWSYEHFNCHQSAVERAVWRGTPLPKDLSCECNPQRPHETAPYQQHGIVQYAKAFPAGSATCFHTNFERAFSRTHDGVLHAQLGSQNIQP
ncbi:glycoside hydrolase family 85 protein, partial [Cercospora zeae-maydis SCOH1-5]